MNVNRRDFNVIGAAIPLGSLLASGFQITPAVEPMRMIRCVVYAIRQEWIKDRDWTRIYEELSDFSANEFYRNNPESSARMKLIDEVIATEMNKADPQRIQISVDEDGEIGWSIVPEGFPGKAIPMTEGMVGTAYL